MFANFMVRFGKMLLTNPAAFVALAEALEGDASEEELVAAIKATQVKATEAAVAADLGPRS